MDFQRIKPAAVFMLPDIHSESISDKETMYITGGLMERVLHRGDIYYVRLPKKLMGSEQAGIRPCVIISSEESLRTSSNVLIVTGTSKIKRLDLTFHFLLPRLRGLPRRTMIEGECVHHVDKRRLLSYRCHLGHNLMKQVDRCVREAMREKHKRKWHGGNRKGVKGNQRRT